MTLLLIIAIAYVMLILGTLGGMAFGRAQRDSLEADAEFWRKTAADHCERADKAELALMDLRARHERAAMVKIGGRLAQWDTGSD